MPQNDDTTIVTFKKPLPRAQPLMPGEEAQDEALVQNFNKGGLVPTIDMDDPDIQAAQAHLQATIKRKTFLKLVTGDTSLDPAKVDELCAAEPWKKGTIEQVNKGLMGFVPEKFEARAKEFPEGSEEYTLFMEASQKAARIYWDQLKVDLRKTCAKFDNDASIKNKRLAYEPLSSSLWTFAQTLQDNPVWTQQYGRIMWMALNLGEEYMNKYGRDKAFGKGYQQWSLKLQGQEPEPVI